MENIEIQIAAHKRAGDILIEILKHKGLKNQAKYNAERFSQYDGMAEYHKGIEAYHRGIVVDLVDEYSTLLATQIIPHVEMAAI